ncbi:MAG: hypothetical protein D6808_01980 [Candidatus Dadabacteria bacterium]|nr:MAG: hypothetical protein D6808_01980 [Candidatus Dadabacteria bacterium]
MIDRSLRDKHRLEAMLLARRILASIESGESPVSTETIEGKPELFLDITDKELKENPFLASLDVTLKGEPWLLPEFPDSNMVRITLKISWGESAGQSITIYYFVPDEDKFDIDE